MKDSNDLHRLIRSLTKSEKRYFKLYCSTEKGVKNYMLLFDEIEKQEEYDEEKLKKKFAGKSFLKQLSVLKHELYNKILMVLAIINNDKSAQSKVRWLNQEAEILRKKKLFSQSMKRLQKSKAICHEHGLYDMMMEVLTQERALTSDLILIVNENELDDWYRKLYETVDYLKNFFDYTYWIDFLNMNVLYPSKANQAHVDELFAKIVNTPLFLDPEKALTPYTRSVYHYMHMTHAFYSGEWDKCYTHSSSRLRIFESMPNFSGPRPNGHISALSNHFLSCRRIKKWAEAEECIKKLKKFPTAATDPVVRAYVFGCQFSLYSFYNPSRLAPVLQEFEGESAEFFNRLDKYNQATLLYSKAYAYFVTGDHRNALRTIIEIKGSSLSFKEDLQLYARMMELMIHYEKQNDDLLQPLVNSFYRFIKRRASLTKFENELIYFFTDMYKKNQAFNMRAFYNRLQELASADKRSMRVLEYIDIITWVRSKVERRPMADLIEANAFEDDFTPGRLAS